MEFHMEIVNSEIFSFTHDAEQTGKLVLSRKHLKEIFSFTHDTEETSFIKENTEKIFSFTHDAEQTGKLVLSRKHLKADAEVTLTGKRKKEIFFHSGDDVLEEYEVTITLSGMRRALLGHIPETRVVWKCFSQCAYYPSYIPCSNFHNNLG
ncbi:hypothetical protein ROHU_025507 [Labeo rohita]|uniref:Uncharacterized protein n=1 Tax=Labeo rohita TaxID=84645 RepID=A0A498MF44_LABRO|nr:hypothetical protein ROHU_025507 [Labeo rohita]